MFTEIFSYTKAKAKIKPLHFNTVVEYKEWVKENNYSHFLPLNPESYYKRCGYQSVDFLGFDCLQDYKDAVVKARNAKMDYVASSKKASATWARKRELSIKRLMEQTAQRTPVQKPVTTIQPSQNDLHSTKQMVEFFIKEDVDIKVIINFLAEYSHPKEVYLIFLEHLKSKLPAKI